MFVINHCILLVCAGWGRGGWLVLDTGKGGFKENRSGTTDLESLINWISNIRMNKWRRKYLIKGFQPLRTTTHDLIIQYDQHIYYTLFCICFWQQVEWHLCSTRTSTKSQSVQYFTRERTNVVYSPACLDWIRLLQQFLMKRPQWSRLHEGRKRERYGDRAKNQ